VLYAVKLDSLGGFLRQRGFDQGNPVLNLIRWFHCCLGRFQLFKVRLSALVQDLYDVKKVLALLAQPLLIRLGPLQSVDIVPLLVVEPLTGGL
jgi:hypothetical protein